MKTGNTAAGVLKRREVHMRRALWVLIPGMLLTGSACGRGAGPDTSPTPAESPVQVEVTNGFALPVEIYAVGSGINHRLGTVHPGMAGHFVLPPAMVGNGTVEFEARSSAAETYRSGPLMLRAGRLVEFSVAAQLFNSTVTVH